VTSPGIVGLATALASVKTPETLYPIAAQMRALADIGAQTRALADTEAQTGALCAAHVLLLAPARNRRRGTRSGRLASYSAAIRTAW